MWHIKKRQVPTTFKLLVKPPSSLPLSGDQGVAYNINCMPAIQKITVGIKHLVQSYASNQVSKVY